MLNNGMDGDAISAGVTTEADGLENANTALIDGVRKFAMDVRELNMDLIDSINPFSAAFSILSKTMDEDRLRQVAEVIAARRIDLTEEEARELSRRAIKFTEERKRLPSLIASDPWEKRMAEGVAFLQRKVREQQEQRDG